VDLEALGAAAREAGAAAAGVGEAAAPAIDPGHGPMGAIAAALVARGAAAKGAAASAASASARTIVGTAELYRRADSDAAEAFGRIAAGDAP